MLIYNILSKVRGKELSKNGSKVNVRTERQNRHRFLVYYRTLLLDLLMAINTPKALSVAICIRYYDNIDTDCLKNVLSCHPSDYQTSYAYLCDAQSCALLKKTLMFEKRYNEDDLITFYRKSEENAQQQRELVRSRSFLSKGLYLKSDIRRIINEILGRVPSHVDGRFGPGSTFMLSGGNSSILGKMQHKPECTPLAKKYVERQMSQRQYHSFAYEYHNTKSFYPFCGPLIRNFLSGRSYTTTVPGDRFCIVEKDIFKPRAMCPQPTGNMLIQLGLADILERRFFRYTGNKLSTTDEIHKSVVQHGSDLYGTIDLSDASDSISLALIEDLFPSDWYVLIRSLTCRTTRVDGKWYPNSKAFAQGCGITFIIETILFYAIAYAVVSGVSAQTKIRPLVSVYGDDILVPIHYVPDVIKGLEFFGFVVNKKKSFGTDSVFKESCGMDTFSGVAVRPVFFKDFSLDYLSVNKLTNAVLQLVRLVSHPDDPRFSKAYYRLRLIYELIGIKPVFVPIGCGDEEGVRIEKLSPYFINYIAYVNAVAFRTTYIELDEIQAFLLFFIGHTGRRLYPRGMKRVWFGLRRRVFSEPIRR